MPPKSQPNQPLYILLADRSPEYLLVTLFRRSHKLYYEAPRRNPRSFKIYIQKETLYMNNCFGGCYWWIIILLIILFGFNGNGCGCGCSNSCGNSCSNNCGCDNGCC